MPTFTGNWEKQMADHLSDHAFIRSSPIADQPRTSLQRKLVWWSLALVIGPTLVCTLWLTYLARMSLSEHLKSNVATVAQTLAAALTHQVHVVEGQPTGGMNQVLDGLSLDPRFAFVQIQDADGRVLHNRIADTHAWSAYDGLFEHKADQTHLVQPPIALNRAGDLVVHRVPIWNPPLRVDR